MKLHELAEKFDYDFHNFKNLVENHTGIMLGVGVGVTILGTVLACKASVKINEEAEEHTKLINDIKDNCKEAQMDDKQTRKEVMRGYRHITADYVRKFWPAVGVMAIGYGLIIKSHTILVAKNEMLFSAYMGLQAWVNKYRETVKERFGEDEEKSIAETANEKFAKEHIIDKENTVFVNGSYLLYNENCKEYEKGNPYVNGHNIQLIEDELNFQYNQGKRVYVNQVMKACGHPEIKGGWKWCWFKPLTGPINFQVDAEHDPEFVIRRVCYDNKTEPIAKLMLNGCVHVDRTFEADVRDSFLADGGVMGGELGKDAVIVG